MLGPMTVEVPPYQFFLWPALQAVIALGGSASIAELDAAVIDRENLSPEVQSVLHHEGPMTEVQYRLAWARTYLKGMGLLTNSQRGVWSVTENGQTVTEDEIPKLRLEYLASYRKSGPKKKGKKGSQSLLDNEIDQAEAEAEEAWKDELLDTCSPCHRKHSSDWLSGFLERLASKVPLSRAELVTAASMAVAST
jgi:restriction system protein